MSTRNVRRMLEEIQLNFPMPQLNHELLEDENESEPDQPNVVNYFALAGAMDSDPEDDEPTADSDAEFELVTGSEHEQETEPATESATESETKSVPESETKHSKSTRNSRRRANKRRRAQVQVKLETAEPSLSTPKDSDEVDEEVADKLLGIKLSLLHVPPEMRLQFSPDDVHHNRHKRAPRERILRKAIIIDYPEALLHPHGHSLTMSVQESSSGILIYTFDHSPEHQKMHREFLEMLMIGGRRMTLNMEAAQRDRHIESLLEILEAMCEDNNMQGAYKLIKIIVALLQYSCLPSLNLANRHARIPYEYIENRPFHIAMLKYMYMLSEKACHRTALEVCKLMMNLDPSDPLALLFIVDTFALRAREFQWLVDVLEHWSYDRDANLMFNMAFSHSLAFFHLVVKSEDTTNQRFAGELLQNAILRFPYVVTAIMSNITSSAFNDLKKHYFYASYARVSTKPAQVKLMDIYAKLTWPRWNEPLVVDWLLHNARVIADLFVSDPEVQASAHDYATMRIRLFLGLPEELLRHMCVIKSMSKWILDGIDVPVVSGIHAFDPLPPRCEVDRYGYRNAPAPMPTSSNWYAFVTSMLPSYDPAS